MADQSDNSFLVREQFTEVLKQLTKVADTTDRSLQRIDTEISDLKESRTKPYLLSMGLFLAVISGVAGYVYNLETRINRTIFELSSDIHDVESATQTNKEMIDVVDSRLLLRNSNQQQLWKDHIEIHKFESNRNANLVSRVLSGEFDEILEGEKGR